MTAKKPVHVTPHEDGWSVRREGALRGLTERRTPRRWLGQPRKRCPW